MVSKLKSEEMENLNYVAYEELAPLGDSERQEIVLERVIHSLIEVAKWLINFEAMVFLRRLNKHHYVVLKQILPRIDQSIAQLSNSIRSGIAVECLMFLAELFSTYQIEKEEDVKLIAPYLAIALHSVFSSKTFIKEQGRKALMTSLGDNCAFINFSFCSELISQMKNDKPVIAETAFELFQKLFVKLTSLKTVSTGQWVEFFGCIDALYAKKREIYIKKAVKILKDLQETLTVDKFNAVLKESGLEKKAEIYEGWIKLREKKTTAHMSISDLKKQLKQKKDDKGTSEEMIVDN